MKIWAVLRHIPRRMREAEIPLLSASLSFSTLLSLVPFLAVTFSVLHLITGFEALARMFEADIMSFFQTTAGKEATSALQKILQRLSQRSWTGTSAVVLFITSVQIFLDLERALNRIWLTPRKRAWWRRFLTVLAFYFLIPLGLAAYAGLRSAQWLQSIFIWQPAAWDAAVVFCLLLFINRWLPNTLVRWRMAALGALTSAMGLALLEGSFTWLTKKVFNYSKIYGSLAALPLLCLWILLTWHIVLFGVALAAGLQKPAARRRV